MSGGFSYAESVSSTAATQALRQPGSAFKPFVYLAGAGERLTPSSIVLDAPIVIDQGPGLGNMEAGQLLRRLLWAEHAAPRAREVAQPDDRAPRPGDRHGQGGRDGPTASASIDDMRQQSRRGARRRRDDAAEPDHRLRDAGQRRQADQADPDRPHPGPPRQDRLPPRRPPLRRLRWRHLATVSRAAEPARPARAGRPIRRAPTRWSSMLAGRGRARHRRARARRWASRSPARPAPPTKHATPGSSASRPISWSASSSATTSPRASASRRPGATAALPIFIEFMQKAWPTSRRPRSGCRPASAWSGSTPTPACWPRTDTRSVVLEAFMPGTEPTEVSPPRDATVSFDGVDGSGARSPPPARTPKPGGLY